MRAAAGTGPSSRLRAGPLLPHQSVPRASPQSFTRCAAARPAAHPPAGDRPCGHRDQRPCLQCGIPGGVLTGTRSVPGIHRPGPACLSCTRGRVFPGAGTKFGGCLCLMGHTVACNHQVHRTRFNPLIGARRIQVMEFVFVKNQVLSIYCRNRAEIVRHPRAGHDHRFNHIDGLALVSVWWQGPEPEAALGGQTSL